MDKSNDKRLDWIGSSREDIRKFPEEVKDDMGYALKFAEVVYVLHCFQKKSKKGIETPKQDMALIERRLKAAEADYAAHYKKR
jgi:phage-related protein